MSSFADIDVRVTVSAAVIETFRSLLSMAIRPMPAEPPPAPGIRRIAGTLTIAGKLTGILNAQFTVDFARLLAGARLGGAPEQVGSGNEIRDLVTRITAIIGGHLNSTLNDVGYPCVVSAARITEGSDFSIQSPSMDRFERYAFSKDGHVVIIEVGLKEPAGADSGIDFRWPGGAGRIPPADLQKLEALDYGHRLAAAAVDGFDSLFSLKLERQEPLPAAGPAGMRCISSVCFAGDATGIVSLHVGHELSRLMAANRLVREPGEIEGAGEAGEMLAAWGHIVGGSLKSALADAGLRCALSMPFFTVGSDFQIESLGLDRFERLGFRCDRHFAWVEMGLKICDRMPAGAHPAPAAVPQDPFQAEAGPSASQVLRSAPEDLGLGLLLDIPLELTVELGRTKMPIHELLKLRPGSAVKLARLEGEPVDILANDVLIARGEVVVRQEKYGIRITEITSRMERLRGLK